MIISHLKKATARIPRLSSTPLRLCSIHVNRFLHTTPSPSQPTQPNAEQNAPAFKIIKGMKFNGRSLYLDYQATTPVDPRVLDSMLPFLTEQYGNPHSRSHLYGWENEEAVELARSRVANLIGADPKEIIFTSGATESNNIAIKGVAHFYGEKKKHIVTVRTEHKCVLDSCRKLEEEGFRVTYLPVGSNGILDLNQLEDTLKSNPDTALVTVMAVNNEIGVVQPITEIGELCAKYDVFFHTDAAQALGKIPIDVKTSRIALMSLSSHKIYGPKGAGALYIRRRPRVRVQPQMSGGGQERGMRSGTLPTSLVVGFGTACEVAGREMKNDEVWVNRIYNHLYTGITSRLPRVVLNGDPESRYKGNLNLSFECVEGESLLMALKNLACSSGSACTSASLEPSYVLRALGVSEENAHTSIRFGIGRFTTMEEADYTIDVVCREVERLRDLSPLWEMLQEGIDLSQVSWSQDA